MIEEFIIRLVPASKPLKTVCKRGHPFVEGSFYLKSIVVKGRTYTVRDCKQCHAERESQYRKKRSRPK